MAAWPNTVRFKHGSGTHLGVVISPVHKQHGVKLKRVTFYFNHHAICSLVARIKLLIKVD